MKPHSHIKQLIISLILCLFFQYSYSQENFLPGSIINKNGDTLHGFIDYRNWDSNPVKIHFKESKNKANLNLSPKDIKGFKVGDEIYESAIIESGIGHHTINDDDFDASLKTTIDTAFIQTIINGVKSLYYYKSNFGNEHFYIKQDSSFQLLIYKKYFKFNEGMKVAVSNKRFIGQLTLYLSDCPGIQKSISELKYEKSSLEKLFKSYYSCIKSDFIFQKKTEKTILETGLIAGMTHSSLKFYSSDFEYLVQGNFKPSINFSAGLFLELVLPRNYRKWSICNELAYTSYNTKGHYEIYYHENKYTLMDMNFAYGYLKVNNMLRYKYPVGPLFVFANLGISNGFAISVKNYRKTEQILFSTDNILEDKALDEAKIWEVGVFYGLGAKYNRLSFEIRNELGAGMAYTSHLRSKTSRYYALLGYKF